MTSRAVMSILKVLGVLALASAILFALGTYWMMRFFDPNPWDNEKFDKVRWAWLGQDGGATWNPRGEMLEDLIKNHLVLGMSKAEVEAMLGRPDIPEEPQKWMYVLGMWSGMHIDYDFLVIRFSPEG